MNSTHESPIGNPVQIVQISEDGKLKLNVEDLRAIVEAPRVRSKKVCVVSMVGCSGIGRSFLLNFILRYFSRMGHKDWMGCDDEPLTGFERRQDHNSGEEVITKGIVMWSEPLLVKSPETGKEIAILLIDSEGSFSFSCSRKISTAFFAITLLLSSVTIFNLEVDFRRSDIEELKLFSDHAKIALEGSIKCPFQDIVFLIHDWYKMNVHYFGSSGGQTRMEEILQNRKNNENELILLNLTQNFSRLSCFLMPAFDIKRYQKIEVSHGTLESIGKEYCFYIRQFIKETFESLPPKTINDRFLETGELIGLFKTYCATFNKLFV